MAGGDVAKVSIGNVQELPPDSVPRWVWKLIRRLAQMEKGKLYRLTLINSGDEPAWVLEAVANLENSETKAI